MRFAVLCVAAVAVLGPAQAFVGNGANLPLAASRSGAAPVCAVSMSEDGKMGRRAALWTTLITGASIAGKADAAGLNLMPPALQSLKDGADKRKADAPAQGSKIPDFKAPEIKAPSFTVPKLGPQKKSKAADDGEAPEKPKSRMTMPKFGQKSERVKGRAGARSPAAQAHGQHHI